MPRKIVRKPIEVKPDINPEVAPTATAVVAVEKTSFDVYNSDGVFIRTYTLDIHGEDAEKLANEYDAKIGASVK